MNTALPVNEGMTCFWCDEPAVARIEVEPARYKTVTVEGPRGVPIVGMRVTRFAVQADVCAAHRNIRDREGGAPVPDRRRRRATGIQQLDIFGGSTVDPRKPDNALTDL